MTTNVGELDVLKTTEFGCALISCNAHVRSKLENASQRLGEEWCFDRFTGGERRRLRPKTVEAEAARWSVVCHSVTSSTVARRLRSQGQRSSRHTHSHVIKTIKADLAGFVLTGQRQVLDGMFQRGRY
ncbi:hypothetical protein SRHO_G00253440 [Serrasalmus rhombeus]